MKKIYYTFILTILLTNIISCTGYKPIFNSTKLEFEIAKYELEGNTKFGNKIYSKLHNASNKGNSEATSIDLLINVKKEKKATSKDSTGKTLEYKISLNTNVAVIDYLTKENILNHNFILSTSYKTQDQYSETLKLEIKSTENLINRTYEELLIKLSEKISTKWLLKVMKYKKKI